ncbi:uncharacterized protein LOC142559392 [Dermacentor variabilis]|uniref:uncharacterized protein LOC142559392 n=1 Tax=Dermacentor variabilis TaxID=34621 RepID=UPI003F5C9AE0
MSEVLFSYDDLFTEDPGCTDLVRHRIETGDTRPLKCNPRPVSLSKRQAIVGVLNEMLATGVIKRSDSPWASPVVLVPKKDGSFRLCVDYRRLNALTRKDAYPLPTIESIVGSLGSAKYFTTLDAAKGYLQVEVEPEDKAKTAFTCHRGLFQFERMPFGLCNAPATFQRLMDRVLGNAKWSHAMCYLDDIVIYSETFEEHIRHVGDILGKLRSAGMTLNPAKAQVAQTRVHLLGFTLGGGSIEPNSEKLRALLDFPAPKDVRGLRRFLGMANFYRSFIPSCAKLQTPLTKLLGKSVEWRWEPEQEQAFRGLSRAIAETARLRLPDLTKKFVVQTDASDLGLGAVLLQEFDGVLHPLAFASRALLPAEKNYSVTEKECLAIVFALRKFDVYLDGTKFVVQTDHSALSWLMRLREHAGRLARWALLIQHYDISVQYRKGSTNVVADALSRAPLPHPADAGGERRKTEAADTPACASGEVAEEERETVFGSPPIEETAVKEVFGVLQPGGDESSPSIEHRLTSPYHPQANLTERFNRTVKSMLTAFARSQKDWADHVNELAFAIRTAQNRSTSFSPAFLIFGRELANPLTIVTQRRAGVENAPGDLSSYAAQLRSRLARAFSRARDSLGAARAQQKAQYDKSHRDVCFQVGDLVLKRNHALSDASKGFSAALAPKWLGPYRVEKRLSPLVYELTDPQTGRTRGRVHIADLKAYHCRPVEPAPEPSDLGCSEEQSSHSLSTVAFVGSLELQRTRAQDGQAVCPCRPFEPPPPPTPAPGCTASRSSRKDTPCSNDCPACHSYGDQSENTECRHLDVPGGCIGTPLGHTLTLTDAAADGAHLPLPAGAATCGKCRTLVIHHSHYTSRMHPEERGKSAARDPPVPFGAATALTDGELAQVCRQRMREDPGFAALVRQGAPDGEKAAHRERHIIPPKQTNPNVVAADQVPAMALE